MNFKTLIQSLFLSCLGVGVAFFSTEVAIRILVPEWKWRYYQAGSFWQSDSELGWIQKSKLNIEWKSEFGEKIVYRTNRDGLGPASANRDRKNGVFRVLLIGDSTIASRAVPEEASLHVALARKLQTIIPEVEIINAGTEGYSADQIALRLKQLLPLYHPDLVIYGFCNNDLDSLDSLQDPSGLPKPMISFDEKGDYQIVVPVHGVLDSTSNRIFANLLQKSAIYRLIFPTIFQLRIYIGTKLFSKKGLMPNVRPYYYDKVALEKLPWKVFRKLLELMQSDSKAYGAKLLLSSHPDIASVWEPYINEEVKRLGISPNSYDIRAVDSQIASITSEIRIPFVSPINLFIENFSTGPFHLIPRDPHSNARGYDLYAEAIKNEIHNLIGFKASHKLAGSN